MLIIVGKLKLPNVSSATLTSSPTSNSVTVKSTMVTLPRVPLILAGPEICGGRLTACQTREKRRLCFASGME